ncbi:thioredoxin family protein [Ureibacillus sp. FSL K6-8385]|uniref:Thioredoxin family protein n=1 Tax=Ureibacillus terrenus TaxID=118246 RepID=A0A540V6W0_9BACL|nr:thioredoxin family protein [Ureibacillus terrenus]MED3661101.1 thioredoxin family protein [Ureibacillus terrenus]MED3764421.1 thioredoxin family protein [Ureibacillus terrenus]TQE91913.1 thioredoxin family protein [Ureibacillus terrenus]
MQTLESIEQFSELKNEERVIFVFSADWCKDCIFIKPFLPAIEEKYSQYAFILVDRDQFIDLCGELDVFGIPSFIAYHKGEEIGRFVSRDRKTQEEIENFIEGLSV